MGNRWEPALLSMRIDRPAVSPLFFTRLQCIRGNPILLCLLAPISRASASIGGGTLNPIIFALVCFKHG